MPKSRLEMLQEFLARDPQDTFSRYGLALEYLSLQRYEEGIAQFHALLAHNPDYIPAYFQWGQACERSGRTDEARRAYQEGMEACRRQGDQKTLNELAFALEQLSGSTF